MFKFLLDGFLLLPAPKAAFLAFLLADPSHLSVEASAHHSALPAALAAASAAAAPLGKGTRDETCLANIFDIACVSLDISVIRNNVAYFIRCGD